MPGTETRARLTAPSMYGFAPSRDGAAHQCRFLNLKLTGASKACWTAAAAWALVIPPTTTPWIVTPSGTMPTEGWVPAPVVAPPVVAGGAPVVAAGSVPIVGAGAVVVGSWDPAPCASGTAAIPSKTKMTTRRRSTSGSVSAATAAASHSNGGNHDVDAGSPSRAKILGSFEITPSAPVASTCSRSAGSSTVQTKTERPR